MTELRTETLELSPYPLIDLKKNIYKGIILEENPICKLCEDKECSKTKKIQDFTLKKCTKELLYFRITLNKKAYFVHGLKNNYGDLPRKDKKKYEKEKIYFKHLNAVKRWTNKTNDIHSKVETNILNTKSTLESSNSVFIHDIKKIYSTILRKMENYIYENCENPKDYDNCVKNLDSNLLGVYKSISLLEHQFSVVDYVANPEAISYGTIEPIKIYKAVDKLVRIFQSISKNHIEITGSSHNQLYIRQSFMTLMFILIDNANKYSYKNQTISINVKDYGHETSISITSYSPYLDNNSKKNIFKKYHRENCAKQIASDGQGIGLYLANEIAKSLKCKIHVNSTSTKNTINNIDYANVTFSFTLTSLDE